jgi:hypothetical protein
MTGTHSLPESEPRAPKCKSAIVQGSISMATATSAAEPSSSPRGRLPPASGRAGDVWSSRLDSDENRAD